MSTDQPTNRPTNQLIFIVGPTATGKTDLAFRLAKEINADILSADSRQVYKGLEVTTGLDLPEEWQLSNEQDEEPLYFSYQDARLYGVDFLSLDEEWSIAHFRQLAEQVFQKTLERKKRLIIVGGSGLYHQSLFLQQEVLNIKPSTDLREELSRNSVASLQDQLLLQYPAASEMLNNSDWNNPRRLIRWIEKTQITEQILSNPTPSTFGIAEDHLWFGLKPNDEKNEDKIRQRVLKRINSGAIQEVEQLLAHEEPQKLPSFTTLGIKDLSFFIQDRIAKEELIELWTKHELQYAKRQMTWFKKREYIQWFQTQDQKNDVYTQIKKIVEAS